MKRESILDQALVRVHASIVTGRLNRPAARRQRGASGIEYVIIAAMIALAIIVAVPDLGDKVAELFEQISAQLPDPSA
ncbi:Flp family type IVb pilin [Halomonas koreensis]|uniref:Flp family type IVb pilin n=1 Tax=Halomonas koreensis TaxID=245385 RepID=A0ABU1G3H7_9GAMM|nr:Flp family type IVb pilin [Halomonas koreensis]MDR5867057.1 Flp family type IVb pilin [Halomonas koreensis]